MGGGSGEVSGRSVLFLHGPCPTPTHTPPTHSSLHPPSLLPGWRNRSNRCQDLSSQVAPFTHSHTPSPTPPRHSFPHTPLDRQFDRPMITMMNTLPRQPLGKGVLVFSLAPSSTPPSHLPPHPPLGRHPNRPVITIIRALPWQPLDKSVFVVLVGEHIEALGGRRAEGAQPLIRRHVLVLDLAGGGVVWGKCGWVVSGVGGGTLQTVQDTRHTCPCAQPVSKNHGHPCVDLCCVLVAPVILAITPPRLPHASARLPPSSYFLLPCPACCPCSSSSMPPTLHLSPCFPPSNAPPAP